jgi:regulation of enolase protein 1 (concanavalin A-like superfamily)
MSETQDFVHLNSIPSKLWWMHQPLAWNIENNLSLTITAGQTTDLFNDPQGTAVIDNSPRLLFEAQDDFVLSAKVTVDFQSTFDAGVLVIYVNTNLWAKLCFEYSPQNQPMIVSVVTQRLSDDCNSVIIEDNQVYLRLAKVNQAFAFHYSVDGQHWHLIRVFSLGKLESISIGFSAQAPTGTACTASFSEIEFGEYLLKDLRSGE